MRNNNDDKTLQRNYTSKWRFMIREYELVKQKSHPKYRFVADFYKAHQTNSQTFLKYYHRFARSGLEVEFEPRRRGPKWRGVQVYGYVKEQVLALRRCGINRYEVCALLAPKLGHLTPSSSTVYRIFKQGKMNRLKPKMKQNKRKIIKQKAGELGHIDCHHLSRDLLLSASKRYYLVCVLDDCTRLAWAEVVEDVKSLTVMFAALKSMNWLHQRYQIQFAEMLSDNGPEFASRNNLGGHPFERMLVELGVKHRYTRPYRPQTNGKVERFWRTLNEDMIDGTTFADVEEFKLELAEYLLYYNELRPHQGIHIKTPKQMNDSLSDK